MPGAMGDDGAGPAPPYQLYIADLPGRVIIQFSKCHFKRQVWIDVDSHRRRAE